MSDKHIPIIISVLLISISSAVIVLIQNLGLNSTDGEIFGLNTSQKAEFEVLLTYKFIPKLNNTESEILNTTEIRTLEIYKNNLFAIYLGSEDANQAIIQGQINGKTYNQILSLLRDYSTQIENNNNPMLTSQHFLTYINNQGKLIDTSLDSNVAKDLEIINLLQSIQ